jgi:hypothetical protein
MCKSRILIGSILLAPLTILAIGLVTATAPAAPPETRKDTLFPGAKLMHKFTKTVYRAPVFVATDKGPRLVVWLDALDPKAPDPRLNLLVWDPIANKQLHKLSYPKDPTPIRAGSEGELPRIGGMAISPDGKRLAFRMIIHTHKPGSIGSDVTTRVKVIDIGSYKVQLVADYKQQAFPLFVYLLFTSDGALMTLRGTTCTIQEPGSKKARASFELTRTTEYKKNEPWIKFQDVVESPDRSQLAVAADGTIIVYDLAKGKKLFEAARAAPEPEKSGDQYPSNVSLAYAPSASEPKLLAVETVVGSGRQKDFVLARLFDLKNKKELGKWKLPMQRDFSSAYFTAKDEPRILHDGKLIDGATGKELHKFDPGFCTFASRDGKVLVRMTKKKMDDKTMTVEVWSLDSEK